MMSRTAHRLAPVALAALLATGTAACGGGGGDSDDVATATDTADTPTAEQDTSDEADGTNGMDTEGDRAFDVDQDTVVTSILSGTDAVDAEWDGSTLRVIFEAGSVDDVEATIPCTAAETIIADDESVVIVYPDGEVDCSEY